MVDGSSTSGSGVADDTVPAWLSHGEAIVSPQTLETAGPELLSALNGSADTEVIVVGCSRGLDAMHEALHSGFDPEGAELTVEQRDYVKAMLFACHYGTVGCGWKS